ncbi:MAG: hypothetical protein ACLP9L_26145 [Thermoguttaceae bacterium]
MERHNQQDRDRSKSLDVESADVAGGPFGGLNFGFQVRNIPLLPEPCADRASLIQERSSYVVNAVVDCAVSKVVAELSGGSRTLYLRGLLDDMRSDKCVAGR